MWDYEFLDLYANFVGFRILVLANRLSCNDDLSRRAHDKLVLELEQLIRIARRGLHAERALAFQPQADGDDHAETIWSIEQSLDYYREHYDGIALIDNDIYVDWATKEWHDGRTGVWHWLHDFEPPRIEVGNDRLNGLCTILASIAEETGIRFNTYASESSVTSA